MENKACFVMLLLLLSLMMITLAQNDVEFIFNGFSGGEQNFSLDRVSIIKPSGLLRLTDRTENGIGHAFYNRSLKMKNTSSTTYSFSTTFVFSINHPKSDQGGHGLAFANAPSTTFPGAAAGHYLGLLNSSTNGKSSYKLFAVEFDTVNGFTGEGGDTRGNHVGINVNDMDSVNLEPAKYYKSVDSKEEELRLDGNTPIHAWIDYDGNAPIQAWIDYDGVEKTINVTLSPMYTTKPEKPLISVSIDLSVVIEDNMYIGFSAATGQTKKEASAHYIMGWSFSMNGELAPQLDISRLPMPPIEKDERASQSSTIGKIHGLFDSVPLLLLYICVFFVLDCLSSYQST